MFFYLFIHIFFFSNVFLMFLCTQTHHTCKCARSLCSHFFFINCLSICFKFLVCYRKHKYLHLAIFRIIQTKETRIITLPQYEPTKEMEWTEMKLLRTLKKPHTLYEYTYFFLSPAFFIIFVLKSFSFHFLFLFLLLF